jgi:hypothetical protein
MEKEPTKYPQVNELLSEVSNGLQNIFQSNLVGVYLMGSLTYDDFNPSRSDVDLVTVLNRPASEAEIEQLKKFHQQLEATHPYWGKRVESQYVPEAFFKQTLPPRNPRPYYGEGRFYEEAPYGNEWLINVAMLYEYGTTLFGKDFKKIVTRLDYAAVRQASARDLFDEWVPKIEDPDYLDNPHYQSYVILNVCRILFTVLNSKIASKTVSANWVKETFPEWGLLVSESQDWEYGMEFQHRKDAERFIAFAVEQVPNNIK